MGTLETKLKRAIERNLPGADTDLSPDYRGVIHGSVIWQGFDDMQHPDRQDLLRSRLRRDLGEDFSQVGVLLLYTPDEMRIMQAA